MCDSHRQLPVSRRGFFQTAAGAAAAQAGAPQNAAPARSQFSPNTKPRKISDHLFVLEDTCNVYLIRDGTHGLLIDFGSGAIESRHRGIANAMLDAGSKLGPALGALVSGLLLVRFGWRVFFLALGAVSLLWLVPWMIWRPYSSSTPKAATPSPGIAEILRLRSARGTFLGHLCGNYFWFFLLTWLPTYLVNERNLSIEQMSRVSSFAYFAMAASAVAAGWFADRMISKGASPTRVRKAVVVSGLTLSTMILPVAALKDTTISIILLVGACMAFGTYTSNHWAIAQTLAGPQAAGRWTSLQNGIGNLPGILAAWLTGIVVDRMHSFTLPFIIAAVFAFSGALMWGLVVGPVRAVWETDAGCAYTGIVTLSLTCCANDDIHART